ncbi:MAG TPA: response regulator [Steroidobacteraceae bacterium]
MNLLIVEDHPTSRKLLRVQLEAEGHGVVEAANGREALDTLARGAIDGIVSDILMPGMDGFRLCYEIRRAGTINAGIPIVLYTGTFFTAADRQLAQSLGADGFIRKPASPAVILAALREGTGNAARRSDVSATAIAATDILEHYNSALVRKLDERNSELQHSLIQIHKAHEEILQLNHRLQTRIARRTTALEATNAELESLARTIASELRAPLQTVYERAHLLEQAQGTAGTQESAAQILAAVRRMNQLLETLSDFIRLGNAPLNRVTLDLDAIVDEAIAAVRQETSDRNIKWERHCLPRPRGDRALLRQVIVGLIGNAVRYTRGCDPAIIEIGSRRGRADEVVIFVRDNGIGGAARPTLPPFNFENEVNFTFSYRIVTRHGGRMWSEANGSNGATHFFSIPQEDGQDTHH